MDYEGSDTEMEHKTERKLKGRGDQRKDEQDHERSDRYAGKHKAIAFERLQPSNTVQGVQAAPSVEGWIIFVTGIHEEAQEDDVIDLFSDCGAVKNIHVNLDRRTGFVKGYALIEFETVQEGQEAIQTMNGKELLGQTLAVDWAFEKEAKKNKTRHVRRQ